MNVIMVQGFWSDEYANGITSFYDERILYFCIFLLQIEHETFLWFELFHLKIRF